VHLVIALQLFLRRHLPLAAIANGLLQLGKARTVDERLRVGQVRRAHGRGALALRPVAGHAVGGEQLLAVVGIGLGAFRKAAAIELAGDERGDIGNALFAQYITPGWHHAVAAAHDGGLDGFRLAAPAPVVVGQVGEAIGALGIGAVAHRAVRGEQACAHLQRLRVLGDLFDRHRRELGEDRPEACVGLGHFLFPLVHAGPPRLAVGEFGLLVVVQVRIARQDAFPVAQARVQHQVAEGEDDGADEQPEPPFRQRVVVLLDAIEGMPDGFVGDLFALALAGRQQQPGQREDGAQGQDGNVQTPEGCHCCLLPEAFACSTCLLASGSSAKGSWVASSKSFLRRGLNTHSARPTKATITTTVPRPRIIPISISVTVCF